MFSGRPSDQLNSTQQLTSPFLTRESERSAARCLQQIRKISSDLRRTDFHPHDDRRRRRLLPYLSTVPAASSLPFELRSGRNLTPQRFIGDNFIWQLRISQTISTMRMAYSLLIVCAALALCSHFAHARPGRSILSETQTSDVSVGKDESVQLSVEASDVKKNEIEHIVQHEPKKAEQEVQLKPAESDNQSESEQNEEAEEVVCTEMGTCYEKRLLVATIDYKNDGPNNPITDPPH
ncbi:hypothetical protein Mapa_011350 [Marchantia paleacea]|nr:hypothetical protein Mapa_011350 [Marchantia paleacea]